MSDQKKPYKDPAKRPSMPDAIKARSQFPVPPYPLDPKTRKIRLPASVRQEVRAILKKEGKPAAMKRVMQLTGGGLRDSKDYVDKLEKPAGKKRRKR
ncbi:MAG: hypothetical protein AAF614_34635 [Chloroflexota bacterium]